ncbi:MAG: DUF3054 domain-containing protein [Nostocoides sp.]
MARIRPRSGGPENWWALDAVAVLIFAAIGRVSHDEGFTLSGVVDTAFPFLGGVLIGWAVIEWRKWEALGWRAALGVLVPALVVGMIGRRLLGDGTAPAFVAVATVVLAVLFLGWRLAVRLIRR